MAVVCLGWGGGGGGGYKTRFKGIILVTFRMLQVFTDHFENKSKYFIWCQ